MDKKEEVLRFLKELREDGFTVMCEYEDAYDISRELLSEISNLGKTIYTVNFMATFDDEWAECRIYCFKEYIKDALKWILQYWGFENNYILSGERYKDCLCVSCRWDYFDDSESLVIPVKVLTSIKIDNYDGENYLNQIEYESVR